MIRAEGFAKTTKNYARTFVAAVSEETYAVQQIAGQKPLSTLSVVSIVFRADRPGCGSGCAD